MQAFRQDMLPSQSHGDRASQMTFQPSQFNSKESKPTGETLTSNAVQQVDDSTELSPQAESQAELQAIIDRLQSATTALDAEEALLAVKDFAAANTNETMIGGAIQQLADMADSVMQVMKDDPSAIGGAFSFDFNASFSQTMISTEDKYIQNTSFSFSFSMETPDTVMQGSMSFNESYKKSENGMSYQSTEQVNIRMATVSANLAANPVAEAFGKLTEAITGIDISSIFEPLPAPEPVVVEPANDGEAVSVSEPYFPISPRELLQMKFEHLAIAQNSHHRLMMELSQFTQHHMEEQVA